MNSSNANNTLIDEMMQLLIAEKEKAFPTILAKLYNQAMIAERETHLGAGLERYEDAGREARQMAQTQALMHQGPLRRCDLIARSKPEHGLSASSRIRPRNFASSRRSAWRSATNGRRV